MLARVGKILGAVVLFLLFFFPVQGTVYLYLLRDVLKISPYGWAHLILELSLILSLLAPLVLFAFWPKVRNNTNLTNDLKSTLWLLFPLCLGLAGFVSLVALEWLYYGSAWQSELVGRVFRIWYPYLPWLILLSLVLLIMFPLRLMWIFWSWAKRSHFDIPTEIKRVLWILAPVFLGGLASAPLYWLGRTMGLIYGPR